MRKCQTSRSPLFLEDENGARVDVMAISARHPFKKIARWGIHSLRALPKAVLWVYAAELWRRSSDIENGKVHRIMCR